MLTRALSTLLALAFAAPLSIAQQPPGTAPQIEPFTLRTFDGAEHPAELGRLSVPENREAGTGKRIELAFIRLKSTSAKPGYPIVFLAGGPGVPATGMGRVPVYYQLFERLREAGDVILLDQRGTGMSSPNLQCSANVALPSDMFVHPRSAVQALAAGVGACAEEARSKGVDLRAFHTNASADDIEDVRRALGAERLNLLGFSYGGELALAAIRRHGDRLGRVALVSPRGPDQVMKLPNALDLHVRRISHLVAEDERLGKEIPDFYGLLRQQLDRFEKGPLRLSIRLGRSGEELTLPVGKLGLQVVLQGMVNDGRALPSVPALVLALSRGNAAPLARSIENIYNGIGGGISSMTVAMDCASGWSADRQARAARQEAGGAILGSVMNLQLNPEVCALVGSPDLGSTYRTAFFSTLPALFLSGTLDGGAPPPQVEDLRWGFPNAVHVQVENGSHETLPITEVQTLVTRYFKGEDVSGATIRMPRPKFLTIEEISRPSAPGRR